MKFLMFLLCFLPTAAQASFEGWHFALEVDAGQIWMDLEDLKTGAQGWKDYYAQNTNIQSSYGLNTLGNTASIKLLLLTQGFLQAGLGFAVQNGPYFWRKHDFGGGNTFDESWRYSQWMVPIEILARGGDLSGLRLFGRFSLLPAMGTLFLESVSGNPAGKETRFSYSQGFSVGAAFDLGVEYPLGRHLALFGEMGYQLLKIPHFSGVDGTVILDDSRLLRIIQDGIPYNGRPFQADTSGWEIRAGVHYIFF